MSEVAIAGQAAADATKGKASGTIKKKTMAAAKTAKKAVVEHPKYSEMVKQALGSLKERGGSSRQAVLKYIMKNFNVGKDESAVNTHVKIALRAGVKNATLKQSKGSGATGSFRLGEEAKKKPKASAAVAKKTSKKAKAPPAAKIRKTQTATGEKGVKSPMKKMTKKATTKSASSSKSVAAKKSAAANKPKADVSAKKSKTDKPKKAAGAAKKVKADKPKSTKVGKKHVAKKTPIAKKSAAAVKKA